MGTAISGLTESLVALDWVWWVVVFIAVTASEVLFLGYNIRFEKNNVSTGSIKVYLDKIPCGVCCWKDSGRVLFSNMCMNGLSETLTGEQLLNGNQFRDAVEDRMLLSDGKMWRFTCRDVYLSGEKLHEMIASDVTAEYAKTQALERDKTELDRLNRELKEYTAGIDDAVRRQEILQAKVNIHDEMNRLMLSTVSAESGDEASLDGIFSLWEQNALLLCKQANETADEEAKSRVEELAEALKIRLLWSKNVPTELTEEQRSLFFSAAQEAIANAAKHAGAKEIVVSFEETEEGVFCAFVNDGSVQKGSVTFAGGLANLSWLAEKQGATVSAVADEKFTLTLFFPVRK